MDTLELAKAIGILLAFLLLVGTVLYTLASKTSSACTDCGTEGVPLPMDQEYFVLYCPRCEKDYDSYQRP